MDAFKSEIAGLTKNYLSKPYSDGEVEGAIDSVMASSKLSDLIILEKLKVYECDRCGGCCRSDAIAVSEDDAARVSKFLEVSEKDFASRFCAKKDGKTYLKGPCPFLNQKNLCVIYPVRPQMCQLYPIPVEQGGVSVYPRNCFIVKKWLAIRAAGVLSK